MADITFKLDQRGGSKILRESRAIIQMQHEAMSALLPVVTAQFFQEFGAEGRFELKETMGDRAGIVLRGADKRTNAILKAHPKWLNHFIDNMNV